MKKTLPLIIITGPTASGKTELAIKLAKKFDLEVISADSRIVYKDLDIVSAKPTKKEQDGVIHHLIDIRNVNEGIYSAGDFIKDAKEIINSATKPLIFQGGTWFYIKSLLDEKNLIEFGENKELRRELSKLTNEELYKILKEKDEKRAGLVHQNNRDKIIRSLELIEAIGGKVSEYEREDNEKYISYWFMKDIQREILYEKINLRVDLMCETGLYEEWERNKEKYPDNEILFNTIGYREFFDLEAGVYNSKKEAIEKIKQHTRNFAKRQLTWFRQNIEKFEINLINDFDEILKTLENKGF